MGAYIVQQEQKRWHTGLLGVFSHIYTGHFYTPLATDTRILQPDTGDGLDALSRRREAPCFLPVCRIRRGMKRDGGDSHTGS